MSFKCDVCGKGKSVGMQVSHSHIRSKKTWSPNIQSAKVLVNGAPKRMRVCTRCLRTGKVQKAI